MLGSPVGWVELCETQLDHYEPCCCWVSCLNPTYKMIVARPIWRKGVFVKEVYYENGTVDRFVRAVLEVPIHGIDRPFLWGIWVSASEQSFDRYVATFDDPIEGDGFFGWISNRIPEYPVGSIRSGDVYIQMGHQRPKVLLHQTKQGIDQLFIDQQQGISVDRAQFLTEKLLHGL